MSADASARRTATAATRAAREAENTDTYVTLWSHPRDAGTPGARRRPAARRSGGGAPFAALRRSVPATSPRRAGSFGEPQHRADQREHDADRPQHWHAEQQAQQQEHNPENDHHDPLRRFRLVTLAIPAPFAVQTG